MGRWKLAKLNGMTRVNPINEMRFEQNLERELVKWISLKLTYQILSIGLAIKYRYFNETKSFNGYNSNEI